MPYVDVGGERLFYAVAPRDRHKRHNLLLIPGAGGNHTHWPAELRRLSPPLRGLRSGTAPGANVYALDLPGHGRSSGRGRAWPEEYAGVVEGFVSAMGLERVTLLGHSMGGGIAQLLGLRRPGWLAGLVLLNTGARLRVHPRILDGINPATSSPEEFAATVDVLCEWLYGPAAEPEVLRRARQDLLEADRSLLHADYLACDRFDAMGRVQDIRAPTLVIAGSADRMTPARYGRYLAEQVPNARYVEIPGGSHMTFLEKPAEVAHAVQEFLERPL
jgi:pimeloyl-ACP methyl ester carboxylesterase